MDNDEFADVLAWLAQMQRDPQIFAKHHTREHDIREVVASLRLSGIMRRRQEAVA